MSKVAHYLQEHLVGEVMTSTDARRYFATDASILQQAPALVVYPANENDVRKTARFTWQLAERGRVIPMTARGSGTDQTGAAIGSGLLLVFPAHMNRIVELDTKSNMVVVEPGINYGKLQQTLQTHNRFLPPYPASMEYSTIGGAIANNAAGEKTVKYGDTRTYVQALRVVLANGEVIETGRLSKREFNKKLGLATFEGEIYRSLDTLLEEQRELLPKLERRVSKNNAGYWLEEVRNKDGSFDLTPLFVGSQGTLGIITEAVLATEPYVPRTTLYIAAFSDLEQMQKAVIELRKLKELPSAIEFVDGNLLDQAYTLNPNQFKDVMTPPYPKGLLLVEYENDGKHTKKAGKKAAKIFEDFTAEVQTITEPDKQQQYWKLRQASSMVVGHNDGLLHAVPIIDDAAVPIARTAEFLDAVYKLLAENHVKPAIWGHAGDASFHLQPSLNLGQVGDRQKAFRLIDEYHKLVIGLGGTISSEAGDGRVRAPYLENQYGAELYSLLQKIKQIFDPYGTLNPGVKFGTSVDDLKAMIRTDYSLNHFYDHLPRS